MATSLDALREQYDELTMRAEVAALKKLVEGHEMAGRLVESDQWGDLVNRREYLFDTPGWGRGQYDYRITSPDDRKRGKCTPFFENEQDLANIRGIGRYLAGATEIAIGAVETLLNYTCGNGLTYEAEPLEENPGEDASRSPDDPQNAAARQHKSRTDRLVKEVQVALDEILEANRWEGDQEAEVMLRAIRDGESILWVQDEGGMPLVRTIEPDYLTEPASTSRLEDYLGCGGYDWSFGIATMPGRHDRPYAYFVQWEGSASDWDVAPAHEVVHIKANVDRGVKRGISDFYGPYLTIERAGKLLGNTLQGAAIQATIAYIKEHAGGTNTDAITSHRNTRATHTGQVQTPTGVKTIYGEKFTPGRVIDTVGTKYHAGPLGQPAHRMYVEVMQAALRIVGARWSMPEYMISGDASNANYASTLVSGSPFVRATERRQGKFKGEFSRLMWIALGHLVRRGRFRQFGIHTLAELKQQVQLKVEAPAVAIADKEAEETIRETRHRNGILSKRTWAGQVDLDYDIEQANILEEPQPVQALLPDGTPNPAAQQGNGQPGKPANGQPPQQGGTCPECEDDEDPLGLLGVMESAGDCGANAPGGGGFQPGNDCAGDGSGGGSDGRGSKLTPDEAMKSPTFQKWFAGSKVTDAKGKPIVVYHGTNADFQEFDPKFLKSKTEIKGFFFGTNKNLAASFGSKNVIAAFVNIQNPATFKQVTEIAKTGVKAPQIAAALMKKGYDGIYDPSRNLVVAFSPSQIKAAEGNKGSFDAKSKNIFEARQSAVAAALESVRTTDEARAIIESLKE